MGRPKALLPCAPDDETFVGRVVRTLQEGGIPHVLVVGRPDDAELRDHIAQFETPPLYVANPAPERGQLSSLIVGIDVAQARGAESVIVMPVDIPQVRAGTVSALVAAWRTSPAPVLRVTCGGRHGHPVIFRQPVFGALRSADPRIGAKAVLRAHAGDTLNVEVGDPGVLRDVDVPAEYDRLFGRP